MISWLDNAVFYHLYPLGCLNAPRDNNLHDSITHRLPDLHGWLDHIISLGCNALYLGPIFESSSHGYDTIDYKRIDRRLGDNADMKAFSEDLHRRGMKLILDAVLNHTGRDFPQFQDVVTNREQSVYKDWIHGLDFTKSSPKGDPFTYNSWAGHYSLVKLNLQNQEVREHLFSAIKYWIDEWQIDGLRLDAADCLALDFLGELRQHCEKWKEGFWLMGEITHSDYRTWANDKTLHSVTNYEAYKGLYSSLADKNYFEIAYALNRQSGANGIYRHLNLYNFADNHDVNRVASSLPDQRMLYPLYLLLFSMPGVPSIYYGSEWGITGKKTSHSDVALRPAIELSRMTHNVPQPDLPGVIRRLADIRSRMVSLRRGKYQQVMISHQQFAFLRETDGEKSLIMLNAQDTPAVIPLPENMNLSGLWLDELNDRVQIRIEQDHIMIEVPAFWGRILRYMDRV